MIDRLVVLFICLFSLCCFTPLFACPPAANTNEPGFCSSFKLAAQCHCSSSGVPARLCTDMNTLYNRMLVIFGTVKKACEYQRDTPTQNCIDAWNCYRSGGFNSQHELCSSTGASCA